MRVRNAVLADDDLGIDARSVDVSEHFGHAADRAARRGGPARELDDHHVAGRCAALLTGRDEDVHQDPPVERYDVAHSRIAAIVSADDPFVAALEDSDDASFGAAALLDTLDANDDAVTVHRFVQMGTGDVDVAAGVERPLRGDKAVAGLMRLQAADIEIHLLGQPEPMATNLDEIARGHQRLDVALERGPLVARHLENLKKLPHGCGMMHAVTHEREHLIAGVHWI